MTDKQIIINKMDKSKRYCEGIDCAWCNEQEPCIYKIANELEEKLLRKEQECERLKEEVSLLKESNSKLQQIEDVNSLEKCYLQQLDQFKAENDKYSLFIEKLCDYAGLECNSEEQAMRTLSDFARQMNKARWIIDRYKQTLTEIKEIAKNSCCLQPTSDCEEHENYKECSRTSDDETVKQIIQKISEVEECKP